MLTIQEIVTELNKKIGSIGITGISFYHDIEQGDHISMRYEKSADKHGDVSSILDILIDNEIRVVNIGNRAIITNSLYDINNKLKPVLMGIETMKYEISSLEKEVDAEFNAHSLANKLNEGLKKALPKGVVFEADGGNVVAHLRLSHAKIADSIFNNIAGVGTMKTPKGIEVTIDSPELLESVTKKELEDFGKKIRSEVKSSKTKN